MEMTTWIEPYPFKLLAALVLILVCVWLMTKGLTFVMGKSRLDEKKAETVIQFATDCFRYIGIGVFFVYAISPFFDVSKLLAGMGILTVIVGIAAQHVLKDVFVGIIRLFEKQVQHGDFVRLNGTHQGVLEEIGIRYMKVRQWDGQLLMMSHGDIKEIQNGQKERRRVIERVVFNYRQDPEEALRVLAIATERCNETHGSFLLKDESGDAIEPFEVYGITNLNAQFHGVEYTVTGLVKDADIFEAGKAVRREIARVCYEQDMKMAEANVYYRTRLNTK